MLLNESQAVTHLQTGQVLAYPTEAVWGLGCDPFNAEAFAQILKLKQRPIEKGVILLAGDIAQIEMMLTGLNAQQRQQVLTSWLKPDSDRATTWLLPHEGQIPEWITGQHDLVAVRVTTHPLCQGLCRQFNGFIVSTSANPAGLEPARNLAEAQHYFADQVGYLNGDLGQCHKPSRILNALTGAVIRD